MTEAPHHLGRQLLPDLTICSVSFHSGLHLRLNWELVTRASGPVRWVVVQNGPPEPLEVFEVLPGVPRPELVLPPGAQARVNGASYHHALALNSALPRLDSRFVLFLDPDFYIVPPVHELLEHMVREELAFFGAPYAIDPTRPRIQGFPCAFCMLVDGARVNVRGFDFLPDASRTDVMADTGYRIYAHYAQPGTKVRYEAALPVARCDTAYPHSRQTFADWCGAEAMVGLVADEYFWHDRPFGLHLHMKLHVQRITAGPLATKAWAKQQLAHVQRVIQGARAHGALV